jgi:hypothetical protein
MSNDPKTVYAELRRETASMLGFKDTDEPSLVQNLQTDCVTMLRFAIDGLQAEVFGGKDVDLNRLASSLAMLRQLLPVHSLESPPQLNELQPGEAEEVEKQWQAKIASLTREHELRLAENPDEARRELEAAITAALEKHPQPPPKAPWGGNSPPPQAAPTEPAEPVNEQPAKQAAALPPPPPRRESDSEWHNRVNSRRPPSHYLRSAKDEEIARMGAYFL